MHVLSKITYGMLKMDSFIFCSAYPVQVFGNPGAYPKRLWAQGKIHPRQSASPSQSTHAHILTHTLRKIWKDQLVYSGWLFDCEKKLEETHQA